MPFNIGPGSARVVAVDPQTGEAIVQDQQTGATMKMGEWKSLNPMGSVDNRKVIGERNAATAAYDATDRQNILPFQRQTPPPQFMQGMTGGPAPTVAPPQENPWSPTSRGNAPGPTAAPPQQSLTGQATPPVWAPLAAGLAARGGGNALYDAISGMANEKPAGGPHGPVPGQAGYDALRQKWEHGFPKQATSASVGGSVAHSGPKANPMDQALAGLSSSNRPSKPAYDYHIEMYRAADAGDAYARDFVTLVDKARAAAQQAKERGEPMLFVPVQDYRNNRMHLINAHGADTVLDMNDEGDKAQYLRAASKIGMSPIEISQWARRASSPLLSYFAPEGGKFTAPDFGRTPRPQLPSMPDAGAPAPGAGQPPMPDQQEAPTPDPISQMRLSGGVPAAGPSSLGSAYNASQKFGVNPILQMQSPGGGQSVADANAADPWSAEAQRRMGQWDYENERAKPSYRQMNDADRASMEPVDQMAQRWARDQKAYAEYRR